LNQVKQSRKDFNFMDASSVSTYLKHSSKGPVNWLSWGEKALARARNENKPLFVSIGYSACHWCHVMDQESFADEAVAEILNSQFIPVKIDREERPDLNWFAMQSVAMMTGNAGWPLNLFLTPDLKPFFGGTYFPREARHGRPAFDDLLRRIVSLFRHQIDEVQRNASQLLAIMAQKARPLSGALPQLASLPMNLGAAFFRAADQAHGGLGGAPKFYYPQALRTLLALGSASAAQADWKKFVLQSLRQIITSGVYDHVGGGFFRMSVDAQWKKPQTEKMASDNALMIFLLAEAYRQSGDEEFLKVIDESLAWVKETLLISPAGLYSSSQEPEGTETFYRWDVAEIRSQLSSEDFKSFEALAASLDEEESMGFLRLQSDDHWESRTEWKRLMQLLKSSRCQRKSPAVSHMVLLSDNALLAMAFEEAYQVTHQESYRLESERILQVLLSAREESGRLRHAFGEGQWSTNYFLEDYSAMALALWRRSESEGSESWKMIAQEITTEMITEFGDEEEGGFWVTPQAQTDIPFRFQDLFDTASPSSFQMAAAACLEASRLNGDGAMKDRFLRSIQALGPSLKESPGGFGTLALYLTKEQEPTELQEGELGRTMPSL
jgi:uncharacterized protein YyaL (SSP411 family)